MTYTHIKIERVPQKLNEDFSKNADIADQQKILAEAAPDLLEALKQVEKVLRQYTAEDPSAYLAQKNVHAAIAKAKGGL